jgi:hypothetical protein
MFSLTFLIKIYILDVEEDLDTLELKQSEINNNVCMSELGNENDQIRYYKNKLQESESKVEELVEVVGKLR